MMENQCRHIVFFRYFLYSLHEIFGCLIQLGMHIFCGQFLYYSNSSKSSERVCTEGSSDFYLVFSFRRYAGSQQTHNIFSSAYSAGASKTSAYYLSKHGKIRMSSKYSLSASHSQSEACYYFIVYEKHSVLVTKFPCSTMIFFGCRNSSAVLTYSLHNKGCNSAFFFIFFDSRFQSFNIVYRNRVGILETVHRNAV